MTRIKVIVTTESGIVLDEFTVMPHKNPDANENQLSAQLRDAIEMRFNVEDED